MTQDKSITEKMKEDMGEIAVLARRAKRKGEGSEELEEIEELAGMWL